MNVATAGWRRWQLRLQNFGIAMAIWFGSGFVSGLVFTSIGVVTRTYARFDLVGSLILAGVSLLVFGPLSYALRRHMVAAIISSAALGWLMMLVFYWQAGAWPDNPRIVPRIYQEALPFLIGGGAAWLCLKCYRWQGWI